MPIKESLYGVPLVGPALRLQDRYQDDDADQYAAAIGFFAFLSLFPLIVLALATTGFVVADDPAQQARVAAAVQDAIPGFSAVLGGPEGQTTTVGEVVDGIVANRGSIGLLGLAGLLLVGLKVVGAAAAATNAVFHVHVETTAPRKAVRQVIALVVLGGLVLLGVAASSALGVSARVDVSGPVVLMVSLAGSAVGLALDVALFAVAYRLLAAGPGPSFRRLWPGAVLAAVGWSALKIFGAAYVGSQMERFAFAGGLVGAIALMLLLYLAGRLYLYGAELSALLYAPGAEMAARSQDVIYEGEDRKVLPDGVLRARPGVEPDLAAPGPPEGSETAPS